MEGCVHILLSYAVQGLSFSAQSIPSTDDTTPHSTLDRLLNGTSQAPMSIINYQSCQTLAIEKCASQPRHPAALIPGGSPAPA
jgi:hypothetical protein